MLESFQTAHSWTFCEGHYRYMSKHAETCQACSTQANKPLEDDELVKFAHRLDSSVAQGEILTGANAVPSFRTAVLPDTARQDSSCEFAVAKTRHPSGCRLGYTATLAAT